MSYDVTVGTQEFNYTSNMGAFFEEFSVHPADMHGEPPYEVAFRISLALSNISNFEVGDLSRDYDAPNGWGTVEGATRFLLDIYMACITETDVDTVEVSM